MNDSLQELYKKYNYPGIKKLYALAHKQGINATYKDVSKFLLGQAIQQTFTRKHKTPGHIVAFTPNHDIQMDLIDMTSFKHKNGGYGWILLAVDVFTRKAYAEPCKSKAVDDVHEAIKGLLEQVRPQIITSDNESSFVSTKVQELFSQHKILHRTAEPQDHKVLGVIDALVRTIKVALYKRMKDEHTTSYKKFLTDVVASYNDTPHSGIHDIAPDDADTHENMMMLQEENVKKMLHNIAIYKPIRKGEAVRIQEPEHKFRRAYDEKYGDAVSTVQKIRGNRAVLDSGASVNVRRLKKVKAIPAQATGDVVRQARRAAIKEKHLKEEGLATSNILKSARQPKVKPPRVLPTVEKPQAKAVERYVVEKFVDHKTVKGKDYYLVKWEGYPVEEATWEPVSRLVQDMGIAKVNAMAKRLK